MMEWLLLLVGVAGFGLAGYWDLKTTEFPDWLPYSIIIISLGIRGAFFLATGDMWLILNSLITGGLFLGFGLGLYYIKQWGDGDAWLLGALGFLYPSLGTASVLASSFMFPMTLLFNFFILSFVYLVGYSVMIGIRNRSMVAGFSESFKGQAPAIGMMTIMFSVMCLAFVVGLSTFMGIPAGSISHLLLLPAGIMGLLVFVQYGQYIEKNIFKRRISVRYLKVGDVPAGDRFRVLEKAEIAMLKRRGGKIWIKEGIRLSPVFVITLLVTFFYGTLLLL